MSGRHQKKRSWFWLWFPAAVVVTWGCIWLATQVAPHPAAYQHPSTYYAKAHPGKPVSMPVVVATPGPKTATVASGGSLWGLAQEYCGNGNDWVNLASANKISGQIVFTGEKIDVRC